MTHKISYSTACRIFPDQGLNPCPLHWQAGRFFYTAPPGKSQSYYSNSPSRRFCHECFSHWFTSIVLFHPPNKPWETGSQKEQGVQSGAVTRPGRQGGNGWDPSWPTWVLCCSGYFQLPFRAAVIPRFHFVLATFKFTLWTLLHFLPLGIFESLPFFEKDSLFLLSGLCALLLQFQMSFGLDSTSVWLWASQ